MFSFIAEQQCGDYESCLICAKAPVAFPPALLRRHHRRQHSEEGRSHRPVNREMLLSLWTLERELWAGGLQPHFCTCRGKMALEHQSDGFKAVLNLLVLASRWWLWAVLMPGSHCQRLACKVVWGVAWSWRILASIPTRCSQGELCRGRFSSWGAQSHNSVSYCQILETFYKTNIPDWKLAIWNWTGMILSWTKAVWNNMMWYNLFFYPFTWGSVHFRPPSGSFRQTSMILFLKESFRSRI